MPPRSRYRRRVSRRERGQKRHRSRARKRDLGGKRGGNERTTIVGSNRTETERWVGIVECFFAAGVSAVERDAGDGKPTEGGSLSTGKSVHEGAVTADVRAATSPLVGDRGGWREGGEGRRRGRCHRGDLSWRETKDGRVAWTDFVGLALHGTCHWRFSGFINIAKMLRSVRYLSV